MNALMLLLDHQCDAELDAAVWIDDHRLTRRVAGFQFPVLPPAQPAAASTRGGRDPSHK